MQVDVIYSGQSAKLPDLNGLWGPDRNFIYDIVSTLKKGEAVPLKLPTGRELRLVYKDVIQPQKQGDSPRYVITASIEAATGKSFLPLVEVNAKPGETFWVGGQEYKGGSLFIGIKVNP